MNLTHLTLPELRQLEADVKRELKRREQEKVDDAKKQILAIAQSVGMDVKDLVGQDSARMKLSKKVATKYRNPSDSKQVWTGRGRRPKWVETLLAAGKSLADLGI